VVSLLLTPLLPDPQTAPAGATAFVHQVCEADAERRVACRGVWLDATTPTTVAASCRFLVLVTVAEGGAP
jgi:chitodextrinase